MFIYNPVAASSDHSMSSHKNSLLRGAALAITWLGLARLLFHFFFPFNTNLNMRNDPRAQQNIAAFNAVSRFSLNFRNKSR